MAVTDPSGEPAFAVGERGYGGASPALIVAEIAQAHDGSLGLAHAYIDAVAETGADAVKFQMHLAGEESTRDEPWRTKFSRQDDTRYDYWRRMEFSAEQWAGLCDHAHERGLLFVCSPFSAAAVDLMAMIGADVLKIASGETFSLESLVARGGAMPVIVSTGMSDWQAIDAAIDVVRARNVPFCVLQCTTKYPTPLTDVGLNVLDAMRGRYGCAVGLSDHSGQVFPALAALARGFDALELHITLDRRMFGPDVSSSLTCEEFAHVCAARDAFHTMTTSPVDKDEAASGLDQVRAIFSKSVATNDDLSAGVVLERGHLTLKKPGMGIPAAELDSLVGRRLRVAVTADRLLKPSDLE
ncbi:MAG: N-acetylneuraminate synthase family protein [Proteobacteria bacterium]|nr:N-acetylneuraminate synthase family protein [Pseudomonadota bacterium]